MIILRETKRHPILLTFWITLIVYQVLRYGENNIIFNIFILSIFGIYEFINIKYIKKKLSVIGIIWLILIFCIILSCSISKDIGIYEFYLILLVPIIFNIPKLYNNFNEKYINIINISIITNLLISLISNGITVPFRFYTANTNSSGIVLSILYLTNLVYILNNINGCKRNKKILKRYTIVTIIAGILTLATASTTSIISSLIITCILIQVYSRKIKVKYLVKMVLIVLIVLVLATLFIDNEVLIEGYHFLSNKISHKIKGGDALSGRMIIWEYAIKNSELFTQGLSINGVLPGITEAHSVYLEILIRWGWLVFINFIIFISSIVISIITKIYRNNLVVISEVILIDIILIGVMESTWGMFGIYEIFFVISLGCIAKNRKNNLKINEEKYED